MKSPATEHAEYIAKRDRIQRECYAEMITDYGRLLKQEERIAHVFGPNFDESSCWVNVL